MSSVRTRIFRNSLGLKKLNHSSEIRLDFQALDEEERLDRKMVTSAKELNILKLKFPKLCSVIPELFGKMVVPFPVSAVHLLFKYLIEEQIIIPTWKTALTFYTIAMVYDIPILRNQCIKFFEANISCKNFEGFINMLLRMIHIEFSKNQDTEKISLSRLYSENILLKHLLAEKILSANDVECSYEFESEKLKSCFISATINKELEFRIALIDVPEHDLRSMLKRIDLQNYLTFKAHSKAYYLLGIQVRLNPEHKKLGTDVTVNYYVKTMHSNEDILYGNQYFPLGTPVTIRFVDKIMVQPSEKVIIHVTVEDIYPCMCYSIDKTSMWLKKLDFKVNLRSLQTDSLKNELFCIQKLFYAPSE